MALFLNGREFFTYFLTMAKNIITEILNSEFIKTSLIALAIFLGIGYVGYGYEPTLITTGVFVLILIGVSLLGERYLNYKNHISYFIIGALGYALYIAFTLFLQLTTEMPNFPDEIKNVLIFGGLVLGVKFIKEKYMEYK